MNFGKKVLAAALAVTMSSAPALAQTTAADSLSVARAGATVEDESELRGGFILPAIVIIAVIIGIIKLTDNKSKSP